MEITVIGIIDFGGVTSAFGRYLYSARKLDNTGYSYLISNAYKLKKYILITMNCCNRRLLLPLEDYGFRVDDIILLGPPKTYLRGTVSKIQLPNGVHSWAFSSSQYVHEEVKSVEEHLDKGGKKLMSKKPGTPIPTYYSPELNITP